MRSCVVLRLLAALITAAALLTPVRPARADGGSGDLQQVVDGYQIELIFEADLKPGVIPVSVHLSDAKDQPVPDARVQVVQNLISAIDTGGHGATESEAHGEVEVDAHGEAEDDHDAAAEHSDGAAAPGQSELTEAHTDTSPHADADAHGEAAAGAHDESVPHTHDESSLFQLSWDETISTHSGSLIFFQAGQWAVHVEFTVDGQEHVAEYVVDVPPPDPGRVVLAAFASLNLAILGAAALIKRKSTAA